MSRFVHTLHVVLFAVGLACLAAPIEAAPTIDISFETDAATGQKLARAQAVFPASIPVTYAIFDAIAAYPRLHDWIRKTTLVSCSEGVQEFLVQFSFPWPVGRQWSRVEVHRNGGTISWKQLEGSLKANDGQISFEAAGDNVRVDYRAAIDVGLPDALTRSYKKQFITEFLTAASHQAESADSQTTLALASPAGP
jgi:uncharacterized membrane protein